MNDPLYDPLYDHRKWWTAKRRQEASERAKAYHAHQQVTDPHLIAKAEAKARGWPFSPLPHRRRKKHE